MKIEPLEHWTSEFVEQPSDGTARLITARVRERLRVGEKLRVIEADRRRLGRRLRLEDNSLLALLPLPCRLIRALRCAGVETLGDLNGVSLDDLCRWRKIGPTSVDHFANFSRRPGGRSGLPRSRASKRRRAPRPSAAAVARHLTGARHPHPCRTFPAARGVPPSG